ncbi:UMP kinase [Candidatus Odyssella acanthamoebae]|uniref:Uridylate kinase n=1 Tax=Candidatus Odyssella acanthamoebae TaxID=91604 RepID=A0A077AXU6_9PROT|nr:UMP kinase [Candidatus Paracaedibacter acanthamoebae]AIK96438.1 uridylate kinase [Candidatus Paracaedibacter acanthamoebae]
MTYKRVLLKISGEALAEVDDAGHPQTLSNRMLHKIAADIHTATQLGVQVCVVIGGGNIFRGDKGSQVLGIDRSTCDYMGMLATVINALALQNAIEQNGMACRVMTAIPMKAIGEDYVRRRAVSHMEKGRVVIFAAGSGNPFFTTDTAAALRALEMECELLLKATKVDGVYNKDPVKHKDAQHYAKLTYSDILNDRLSVMDATAVALLREHKLPLAVFSIFEANGFANVLAGKGQHTLISEV